MKNTLLLGTRKGLLVWEKKNGRWEHVREAFPGIPVSYVTLDERTGILWTALDHGHWGPKLHCSQDMGETWTEIATPHYPEGSVRSDGEPATNSYIWIVQPGGDDQPNRIYVGTEPGGLFQSNDGGETFELVSSLWEHPSRNNWFGGGRDHPGVCSIVIDPNDSQHIYIGISVGGVYESTDGGVTWDGCNKGLWADYLPDPYAEYGHDPHFMLMSPADHRVLWQQNHCGIFRTADGAKQWENISQKDVPAYFGFPIALDENDPEVAWVAPAISAEYRIPVDRALCISRTEDGGKTWTALRDGLPQDNCYDIIFRHALDNTGDSLAFGTTAGNVYLSDDRGDHWEKLTGNLAVVYSVRFV